MTPDTRTAPDDPPATNPLDPEPTPAETVRENWGWFLVLGVAQLLVGALALVMTAFTTLVAVLLLGGLALAAAAVEVVSVFWSRTWQEGLAHLLVGLLYGVFGVMLLANPELAASTLTLVLAVLLLVNGVVRFILAVTGRYRGWGWAAAGGVMSALLGGLIWADWPDNSLWVIGLFIGIDLVVMGAYWVALALAVRGAGTGAGRAVGAA